MKTKTILFSLLCLLLILPSVTYSQYVVGDSAADFSLYDLDGNLYTLSDFRGHVVLLNFFRTT